MKSKIFSDAMSELDSRYIDEAVNYKKAKKSVGAKLAAIAACLAVIAVIGSILVPSRGGMAVSVYAYGTDEEITTAGVVMLSGTISDTGEMKGPPLMFYLSGENIVSVRFSCKNQQINFMDWTEKRDEYGNARNFTVAYGEDESEYYYLTINWVPDTVIRELTDNKDSTIATLPEEMRNDIIVMEITFENGKTVTKAITISLLENGTFFAVFDDYKISKTDTFVKRPDSEAIPRDVLYSQGDSPADSGTADAAPMVYVNDTLYRQSTTQTSFNDRKDDFTFLGVIESDIGSESILDGIPKENFQANHPIVGAEVYQYGNDIVVEIGGKYWLYENVSDSALDKQSGLSEEEKMQLDPSYGTGIDEKPYGYEPFSGSRTSDKEALNDAAEAADKAARAYYENTVFEVVSLELRSQTENEIVFSACVSKGGTIQEPERTVTLQLNNGMWEVVNEGY